MKRVCMIPARIGSTRVRKKNLRYLGDKPLVAHVLKTCVDSNLFDEVYLNSDDMIFSGIAERYGAKFYHRPAEFASSEATNDDFVDNFFCNINCDEIVQVNPTAPFISFEDLKGVCALLDEGKETVQTIKAERIEGMYKGDCLNFDSLKQMPRSQDLEPIYLYSSSIMAFKKDRFLKNMRELGAATYGGNGSIGYFITEGNSNVDIDYEEDFQLAEIVYDRLNDKKSSKPRYFDEENMSNKFVKETDVHDADRELILGMDGVKNNFMFDYNKEVVHIKDIIEKNGYEDSWSHTLINSPSNSATIIAQMPGEGNRMHYHPDWDEWWYILDGKWEWTVDGEKKSVRKGDVVFIERNRPHRIQAKGDEMAIRLAVSRSDVVHSYEPNNY